MKQLNTIYIYENEYGIRSWTEAGTHYRNIYQILVKLKSINRKLVIKRIAEVVNR